jgi:RNA polymerase sigma factor (sigma-70 family)
VTKPAGSPQYSGVSRPGVLQEFDAVYEREFDYVWRSCGRLGVPPADLDDAAHDVFIVLYRRWNELDRGESLRPWLFGVARRVAAAMRAKRREQPIDAEPAAAVDPLVAKRNLLWNALAKLDDDRRVVLVLHDLEGHTGEEIAALLDIPANTVHSRLRLARADLLAIVKAAK